MNFISHHIVRKEIVDNKPAWVHRKGATPALAGGDHALRGTPFAETGHPILLPGNPPAGPTAMVADPGAVSSQECRQSGQLIVDAPGNRWIRRYPISEVIEIDGAQGEGGGQILRSSLTLALVTGKAVRIENIRSGRDKPGLMRQHLTAVRAAAEVGDAQVEGDEIGSQTLRFFPRAIKSGSYTFSVGTAGSGTLVLQTVLPALMIADGPSEIVVAGGTHNQWAPPFEFLTQAYFPLVNRIGPDISAGLERHGFYPAGGGRFNVYIRPAPHELEGLQLTERGEVLHRSATAIIANLPRSIAQREIDAAAEKLNWSPDCLHIYKANDAAGPGNVFMVELRAENVNEVFTGFGRRGVRAERVASEAVNAARHYLAADVPVGTYLADQLLLPLGIAAWKYGAKSQFRTLPLSRHSVTHIDVLRRLLGVSISTEQTEATCLVSVG